MNWTLRPATANDDRLIAAHFRQMWLDLATPAEAIEPDWEARTCNFLALARQNLEFAATLAIDPATDRAIGSASSQLFAGLYPNILTPAARRYGYIWGVFVEAPWRRQGLGRALTQAAIAHLKAIGCTRAILNASPLGEDLYQSLGFVPDNSRMLSL